ncbi:MAG TPA: hypothetical protein DCP73_13270 [Chloroflexi bacterium]|nr:hypothetical protein [Chloroflexota bacterium]
MFKPNPKAQVELKFRELFGRDHKPVVTGSRLTLEEARRRGVRCLTRDGIYFTELFVNGTQLATAAHADWRKAYKLLKLEVEKLFADGMVQS